MAVRFLHIATMQPKRLLGNHLDMSFSDDRTAELWRKFMPRRGEVANRNPGQLFSLQQFPEDFDFSDIDPHATFRKWAAAEVDEQHPAVNGMHFLQLPPGKYAVFLHSGPVAEAPATFRYIFMEWLPTSGYTIDHRPHFELLGPAYSNTSPDSQEEIWIPVK